MPAPDRCHFSHPFYLLIAHFMYVTLASGWEVVNGHFDLQFPPRRSSWQNQEPGRHAALAALGSAVAGGLIVLRAWVVFAFPAKGLIFTLLLSMDAVLFLIGTHSPSGEVSSTRTEKSQTYLLVAALAFLSLLFHHLLDVGVYFLAPLRSELREAGADEDRLPSVRCPE
jgi:hypothetical protein